MNRIVSFEYLRMKAIIGVLLCHYCHNYHSVGFLGHYCGSTYVPLFILMSGMLIGYLWNVKGRPVYGIDFIKKRFSKLSFTYYPFLVFMFAFIWFSGDYNFSIKDVVMHVAYLSWFDKLPNFGHLYFMTMIAVCYIAASFVSRLGNKVYSKNIIVFSCLCVFSMDYLLEERGLPGYMLLWLWLFLLAFIYSPKIICWSENNDKIKILTLSLLINIIAITLFFFDIYEWNHCISKWVGAICCVCVMVCVINLQKNATPNRIVSFIASISFEIYLMFNIISEGKYSLMMQITNPNLALIVYLISCIAMGYCLHIIVIGLKKIIALL